MVRLTACSFGSEWDLVVPRDFKSATTATLGAPPRTETHANSG